MNRHRWETASRLSLLLVPGALRPGSAPSSHCVHQQRGRGTASLLRLDRDNGLGGGEHSPRPSWGSLSPFVSLGGNQNSGEPGTRWFRAPLSLRPPLCFPCLPLAQSHTHTHTTAIGLCYMLNTSVVMFSTALTFPTQSLALRPLSSFFLEGVALVELVRGQRKMLHKD